MFCIENNSEDIQGLMGSEILWELQKINMPRIDHIHGTHSSKVPNNGQKTWNDNIKQHFIKNRWKKEGEMLQNAGFERSKANLL